MQRQLSLKCCADNQVTLSAYAEAAQQAERPLEVLIECATGQKRAGVETVEEMLMLAGQIQDNPWLVFAGLLFYPPLDGWPATQTFYHHGAEGLAEMGLKADIRLRQVERQIYDIWACYGWGNRSIVWHLHIQ